MNRGLTGFIVKMILEIKSQLDKFINSLDQETMWEELGRCNW